MPHSLLAVYALENNGAAFASPIQQRPQPS